MKYFFIKTILAAGIGEEESDFWTQLLVLLLLAAFGGVYSLVKKQQKRLKEHHRRFRVPHKYIALCKNTAIKYAAKTKDMWLHITKPTQEKIIGFDSPGMARKKKLRYEWAAEKNKDLHSGMELLELDFLLSIVENTEGNDHNDVAMRKLNFNELFRRQKLNHVNSSALKVYTINPGNLYGKDIQYEAMQQLVERTTHNSENNQLQPALQLSS